MKYLGLLVAAANKSVNNRETTSIFRIPKGTLRLSLNLPATTDGWRIEIGSDDSVDTKAGSFLATGAGRWQVPLPHAPTTEFFIAVSNIDTGGTVEVCALYGLVLETN